MMLCTLLKVNNSQYFAALDFKNLGPPKGEGDMVMPKHPSRRRTTLNR
jgi:hypothetical protein